MLADNSLQLSEQAFFVSKHTPPPTPPKLQPSLSVNCVYLLLPFWKRQVATREFFPLSCSGCIGVPGDSALPDILIWQRPGQEPFLEGSVDRALGTVLGTETPRLLLVCWQYYLTVLEVGIGGNRKVMRENK